MVIKVTAPKVSQTERENAIAAAQASQKLPREEIPRDFRISQTKNEDWIEHETERGTISYSAQYSDDTDVFRHIRVSSAIFREVERILAQRPNRLLTKEDLAVTLRIPMSGDWKHYHMHSRSRVLLFKRPRRDKAPVPQDGKSTSGQQSSCPNA